MASESTGTTVTMWNKVYFAAVGVMALWVGVWGYFIPGTVDEAIPWMVPPLHARFLGAVYFSATAFLWGAFLAKRWTTVRDVVAITMIWTGMLGIISTFYLPEFDFRREQVWIWWGAYIVYPIIGAWLLWQRRAVSDEREGDALPAWVRGFLTGQGVVLTLVGLALLLMPTTMIGLWPWNAPKMLIQIYSAPFLAYGIGSYLLSRRYGWPQIRIGVVSLTVLAALVVIASIIHRALFNLAEPTDIAWFVIFGAVAVVNGALSAMALTKMGN